MQIFPCPKFSLFRTFPSLIVFYSCLLLFVSLLSPFVLLFTALLMLLLALLMHLSVLFILLLRYSASYSLTHLSFPICPIVPYLCHSPPLLRHRFTLLSDAWLTLLLMFPYSSFCLRAAYAALLLTIDCSSFHSVLLYSSRCLVFMYIRALFLHCRPAIQLPLIFLLRSHPKSKFKSSQVKFTQHS